MNIYIAASSEDIDIAIAMMDRCRAAGFTVTSTWPEEIGQHGANPRDASEAQREAWANQDAKEVREADILWLMVSGEKKTEGGFWEAGYADGCGKYVIVSGNNVKRSIFTARARDLFDSHDVAFRTLCRYLKEGLPK